MNKKKKCKICGIRFAIIKEHVYEVCENVPFTQAFTSVGKTFDAIDCPGCGCQQLLAERKPIYGIFRGEKNEKS